MIDEIPSLNEPVRKFPYPRRLNTFLSGRKAYKWPPNFGRKRAEPGPSTRSTIRMRRDSVAATTSAAPPAHIFPVQAKSPSWP